MQTLTKFRFRLCWIFLSVLLLKVYYFRIVVLNDANILKVFLLESGFIVLMMCVAEIFFKRARVLLYYIFDIIYSILLFSIILYHQHFGRIANFHSLKNIAQIPAIQGSIAFIINPLHLILFLDILLFPVLFMLFKRHVVMDIAKISRKLLAFLMMLTTVSTITWSVWGRIDFDSLDKDIAIGIGLSNYEFIEAVSSYIKDRDDKFNSSPDEISGLKGIGKVSGKEYFGAAKDMNVIFIQVESLQNFPVGLKVDGIEITPNINKLLKESLYFPKFYSQIALGNTSDAEFMANTSIYPVEGGAIATDYNDRQYPSLPRILKNYGYRNATFHGNWITFWNRDKLYAALGFDKYYDINFFGFDDTVGMGPSDEVVYKKTLEILKDMDRAGQRFYANIVTLSSHHPFDIPPYKKRIEVPKYIGDSMAGRYLESVNYADYALGEFIKGLEEDSLLDKTLLVIYGDHYGLPYDTLDEKNRGFMKKILGREYSIADSLNVPLIIRIPGRDEGKVISTSAGQVDIMPTVANLLGLSMDGRIYFGRDVLNSSNNMVGIRYYMPSGSFINNDYLAIKGGDTILLSSFKKVNKSFLWQQKNMLELVTLSDRYVRSLMKVDTLLP